MEKHESKVKTKQAQIISTLLHPILMMLVFSLGVIWLYQIPLSKYIIVYLPSILGVFGYIFITVFLLHKADFDFSDVHTRPPLFIIALIGLAISYLLASNILPELAPLTTSIILIVGILTILTFFWKVSLHATVYTMTVLFFASNLHFAFWVFLLLLPLLYWARIYLHKHVISQLIIGSLLALIILI